MYRTPYILLPCWFFGCVVQMPVLLRSEEPPPDAKLQKLADDARSQAEGMEVGVAEGKRVTKAKLHSNALMKYTDVARQIRSDPQPKCADANKQAGSPEHRGSALLASSIRKPDRERPGVAGGVPTCIRGTGIYARTT